EFRKLQTNYINKIEVLGDKEALEKYKKSGNYGILAIEYDSLKPKREQALVLRRQALEEKERVREIKKENKQALKEHYKALEMHEEALKEHYKAVEEHNKIIANARQTAEERRQIALDQKEIDKEFIHVSRVSAIINKNTDDKQIQECIAFFKSYNIEMKVSNIKRNKKGEIYKIKISISENSGDKNNKKASISEAVFDRTDQTIPDIFVGKKNGSLMITSDKN